MAGPKRPEPEQPGGCAGRGERLGREQAASAAVANGPGRRAAETAHPALPPLRPIGRERRRPADPGRYVNRRRGGSPPLRPAHVPELPRTAIAERSNLTGKGR